MFKEYLVGTTDTDFDKFYDQLKKDFGMDIKSEKGIRFAESLLEDIVTGRHTWTVRYKPNTIRVPFGSDFLRNRVEVLFQDDEGNWEAFGTIAVPTLVVGHVRDWPKDHKAIFGSGWRSKRHMVQGISDIYEPINGNRLTPQDILGAYEIQKFIVSEQFLEKHGKQE